MDCLGLLLLIPAGFAAAAAARWIAEPIETLAKSRRAHLQFTLLDLLILFALLQLAVGTVQYLVGSPGNSDYRQSQRVAAYVFDAFAALVIVLSWWCGVSMVSRAGIGRGWHRAIILAFVVPCGTVSLAALVLMTTSIFFVVLASPGTAALMIGIMCALLAVTGVCGQLTRWIAAKYQPSELPAPSAPAEVPQPQPSPPEE